MWGAIQKDPMLLGVWDTTEFYLNNDVGPAKQNEIVETACLGTREWGAE